MSLCMNLIDIGDNPGPAALGHDPVVAGELRKSALDAVEQTGAVRFRRDPALPWISTE